jgi:hypothetical protein
MILSPTIITCEEIPAINHPKKAGKRQRDARGKTRRAVGRAEKTSM